MLEPRFFELPFLRFAFFVGGVETMATTGAEAVEQVGETSAELCGRVAETASEESAEL